MNARSALVVLREEATRNTGEVRGALEIAVGVIERHLAHRDRLAAKRKEVKND